MKKRVLLSIVITGVAAGLSSQYWLYREPVEVTFEAEGKGQTTFEIVLNKKDDDLFSRNNKAKLEVNLDTTSEITIPVYKAKHPKRFKSMARQAFNPGGGGLKLRNIKVDGHLLDLNQFYVNFCTIKIEKNSILLTDLTAFSQLFSKEKLNIVPKLVFDARVLTIILILSYLLAYKLTSYIADFKSVKNQSRIEIVFLTVFFVLLILPALKINDEIYSKAENRKLAEYKPFITKNEINYNFGQDFNSWFSDRFFGRTSIIHLYNKLRFLLTGYIYNQGEYYYNKKTQWAFSTGWHSIGCLNKNFPVYEKNIKKLEDFCQKNGIKLYIVLAPVKGEVYPEAIYPFKLTFNNGEQFEKYINTSFGRQIATYPLKEMQDAAQKEYAFPQGDPHWSEYGAYSAYKVLMHNIKKDFPDIKILNDDDFNIEKKKLTRTDYPGTYFNKGHEYNTMRISIKHNNSLYPSYESKFADKLSLTNRNSHSASDSHYPYGNPQKTYIIGSSFSENLYLFLRYTFKEVKKRRINNSFEPPEFKMSRWEKEILEFKPDIMIIVIQSNGIKAFSELYGGEK